MSKTVVSLCDYTGIFTEPWREAGYKAIHIDPQRPNNGTILEMGGVLAQALREEEVVLVAGFPPCTDVAVSGAAHFERKRREDPHFQAKAALVAEQCRMVGVLADCPWFFENPVSVFASIFGPPNERFHPYEYGGYLPEDDEHPEWPEFFEPRDAYRKRTCLWTGGGFVMPERKPVDVLEGHGAHYRNLGGNRARTRNIRSSTPRGFARAVFEMFKGE